MIDATAFFPGGKGLWMENEADVFPSILVLGQDFSTVKDYEEMLMGDSNDLECPTWRNLRVLFGKVGIDLSICYFSNVFMGLRKTNSAIGRFPGFRDKEFTQRNIDYLAFQIDVIKPRVIITLGIHAATMLGNLSPIDLSDWKLAKRFRDINSILKQNVDLGSHRCICVSIVHPSMWYPNAKQMCYMNIQGNDAGISVLSDAINA